jgi:hypothetical protein
LFTEGKVYAKFSGAYYSDVELEFTNDIWFWRGPSPFHFVTVPEEECLDISTIAASVTYGWGMIPATVSIGATEWTTSLFPKNGVYIVPIKKLVRDAENLEIGDNVTIKLRLFV